MLKSKTDFPPGGFRVFIAETNFETTPHIGFEPTVMEVQRHRLANTRFGWATDVPSIRVFVEQFTEARLRSQYGAQADMWLSGGPATDSPVPMWPPLRARAAGADVAGASKAKAGIGLIRDFLGNTLKAVPRSLAEKRASVCSTCPENQAGGLVARLGGEALKLMLQARTDLKLETSFDDKLHDCAICTCSLKLKTHVELAFILERTTPEQMTAFPDFCWIKRGDK